MLQRAGLPALIERRYSGNVAAASAIARIASASSPNFNRPLFALRRSLGYDETNGRTTLGYSTIVQRPGDGPSVGDRHRIDCSALAQ